MKKNSTILFCICTVLFLSILLMCKSIYTKKDDRQLAFKDMEAVLFSLTFDTYLNQGICLENVCVESNNITCSLFDLVKDDQLKFVFVLPNNGCPKCIKFCEKSILEYLPDHFQYSKMIILSYGIKDEYSFKHSLKANEYFMPEPFDIPLIKKNTPFFFALDNSRKINFIFIPDHRLKKQTEAFFSVVKKVLTPHEF